MRWHATACQEAKKLVESQKETIRHTQEICADKASSSAGASHDKIKRISSHPHTFVLLTPSFAPIFQTFTCIHVQAQQSLKLAAYMELRLPVTDYVFIARSAAQELARNALFQPFRDTPFLTA